MGKRASLSTADSDAVLRYMMALGEAGLR
jgi:hypothetical protein